MNLTSNISEKIKNISIKQNIIHIGEVKKFDGNIVYTDPFPAPIGSLCIIYDCNKNKVEINFKLDFDPSLGRGDFTIDMGGVIQAIKYKKVIE